MNKRNRPKQRDTRRGITDLFLHPATITFTFPPPANTNVVTLTFSAPVALRGLPTWAVSTKFGTAQVLAVASQNLTTWSLQLNHVLNGAATITIGEGDTTAMGRAGELVVPGIHRSLGSPPGPPPPVPPPPPSPPATAVQWPDGGYVLWPDGGFVLWPS